MEQGKGDLLKTVSLRMSAKELCAPNTINRFLKGIRNDPELLKLFWPRLVRDRSINCGKQVSIKLDDENLEFLRNLKKELNIFSIIILCCFKDVFPHLIRYVLVVLGIVEDLRYPGV